MYKLPENHLDEAKKIAVKNRIKKRCDVCYDRAYVGTTNDNFLVICHKCVDMDKAMQDWKDYVKDIPELKEHLAELFEEDNQETE